MAYIKEYWKNKNLRAERAKIWTEYMEKNYTAEIEKALSCVAVLRHAEDNLLKGKRRQRANSHTVSLFVDCRNILVISI